MVQPGAGFRSGRGRGESSAAHEGGCEAPGCAYEEETEDVAEEAGGGW